MTQVPHNTRHSNLSSDSEQIAAFTLLRPAQQRVPFVFSSPHSGRNYSAEFLNSSLLDNLRIRQSEDFLVDDLFSSVVKNGAPLIAANHPRAFIDVNREPYELDASMFNGKLPAYANSRSIRVAGGLGTIARIVSEDDTIYKAKLDVNEGLARVENIYKPFHGEVRNLLAQTWRQFGYCVLIDCHSMPSSSVSNASAKPDFVVGDRYGTSASGELVAAAITALRSLGYAVSLNKPYAGGFITEHYGRPSEGLHAIQIEVNRGLYMDETNMVPTSNYANLKSDLDSFVQKLMSVPDGNFGAEQPIAAE